MPPKPEYIRLTSKTQTTQQGEPIEEDETCFEF